MTETSSNFQNKTELIEDTLLRIRDNKIIVDYLTDLQNHISKKFNKEEIETQLKQSVNLYSDKNTEIQDNPFLDKVYLYDQQGSSFSSFYSPPLQSLKFEYDKKYKRIYNEFIQSNEDVKFIVEEDSVNLLFTLYSNSMENIGTIIFVINRSSIDIMMQNIQQYDNAFWFMYDGKGQTILEHNTDRLTLENREEIINTYYKNPYDENFGNSNYLVYTERMNMDFNTVIGIPSDHLFLLLFNSIKPYIYILIAVTLLVILISVIFINRLTRPLKEVASSIRLVGKGKLNIKMPDFNSREFAYIGEVFNSMTDRINHLVKDVYEKQLIIKESELKFLQTQVNPHFMFNVLNTIALQAKMEASDDVSRMISSFAGLIQASIYRTGKEKIQIEQELIYVDYYLYLQSHRFGDKLNYSIECNDSKLLQLYVPKLAIQFLVENAVMHGIEPKYGDGSVNIIIYSKNENLCIDVKDNGIGFEGKKGRIHLPLNYIHDKKGHNHVGLNNTHKIIQYFYGTNYGLHIHTMKDVGTTVTIQIPFDTGDNKEVNEHV